MTGDMGSGPALALRYGAFAALAAAANLAAQALSLVLYAGRHDLHVAMTAGTLAGLFAKYALDRRWIFRGLPASPRGRSREFALYALTGVLTTCLFWATELTFAAMGNAPWLPVAGAVLGLSAGYALKYRLDRRFVFRGAGA